MGIAASSARSVPKRIFICTLSIGSIGIGGKEYTPNPDGLCRSLAREVLRNRCRSGQRGLGQRPDAAADAVPAEHTGDVRAAEAEVPAGRLGPRDCQLGAPTLGDRTVHTDPGDVDDIAQGDRRAGLEEATAAQSSAANE